MNSRFRFDLTRREMLLGAAGLLGGSLPFGSSSAAAAHEYRIVAKPGRSMLRGADHPSTDVWSYDGAMPRPTLRLRQGEPVRITVANQLEQETTVHWHGIRLPISMDGVPGISQRPIAPGESFTYAFTPPDAGTFWYHPHANSLQQQGRGLFGALIVEESDPVPVDRDLLWVMSDWRLRPDGTIAGGFGNPMEAAMSGRVGNTVTLNGIAGVDQPVRAGERIRLRLINASLARIMALRLEGHNPTVVAVDGQPCEPHAPDDGRLLLGPAMRVDVIIDMLGEPGGRYSVIDDFYDGLSYTLTQFVYAKEPATAGRAAGNVPALSRNPLPEPDLASAVRHELTLQGGMMSDMGGMPGMNHAVWAINGASMMGDGHAGMAPALSLKRMQSTVLGIANDTAWWHPIHFHGHSFKILRRNGVDVPFRQWGDTVLLAPKDRVDCAFVADNPGDWMLHCHVVDHQVSGMMTVLRIG